MTESDAVAVMLARDEIRQLPYRYAAAIESRDVDAMADLYAPQARFGEYGDGPDGLRRLMTQSLDGSVFAVILVANHMIEIQDAVRARGQVWAHCFAQTRAEGFVEQLIKYEDAYLKHEDRWLFLHRRHRLWYGQARIPSPFEQGPAGWPARQVGVGDLPLSDPAFTAWRERRR